MTVFVPRSPTGFTIFCDEVRQEINGKLLFLGVYTNEMLIAGTMPIALPVFTAFVNYQEKINEIEDHVIIKLFVPGMDDSIFQIELPPRQAPPATPLPDEDLNIRSMVPIRIAPFPILSEGLIRVRAFIRDDEIRLGTLAIRVVPSVPIIGSPPT
jgi:hypothetical protein